MIDNETLTNISAFHAQQSIEKSFKALLELHNKNIPKKHDLLLLSHLVSSFVKVHDEELLDTLNSLYTESRYPGDLGLLPEGKPTVKKARQFFKLAKEVYTSAKKEVMSQKDK